MSFNFNWSNAFSPSFRESAKTVLETALNKGNTPALIVGKIEVRELDMGVIPPTLTLLEIGDLQPDRFRGIFRLGYAGDAHIVVGARVQANPLKESPSPFPSSTAPLAAHRPLLVPMALRLSNLKLKAIVVLVVSKQKGITLVFKNDPLESLDVSSTFDSIAVLKGFIQREIEGQLREMFREDLPGIIHTLSQQWFTGEASTLAAPTPTFHSNLESDLPPLPNNYSSPPSPSACTIQEPIFPPYHPTPRRTASQSRPSSSANPQSELSSSPDARSTFPDIEEYDPTYGLRPEGLPTHTALDGPGLGKLWERSRGLAQLVEGESMDPRRGGEGDDEEYGDPGDGDEDDRSVLDLELEEDHRQQQAYETIPAVGGGTITRPRVFLAQSYMFHPTSEGSGWGAVGGSDGSVVASGSTVTERDRGLAGQRRASVGLAGMGGGWGGGPSTPGLAGLRSPGLMRRGTAGSTGLGIRSSAPVSQGRQHRQSSSMSVGHSAPIPSSSRHQHTSSHPEPQLLHRQTGPSSSSNPSNSRNTTASSFSSFQNPNTSGHATPPLTYSYSNTPTSRSSLSIQTPSSAFSPSSSPPLPLLREPEHHRSPSTSQGLPETISQLSMLQASNHTLSPYTRSHSHVTVRSQPHIYSDLQGHNHSLSLSDFASSSSASAAAPIKARRRRLHRIQSSVATTIPSTPILDDLSPPSSSPPPSRPPSAEYSVFAPSSSASSTGTGGALPRNGRPRLTPRTSYGFPSLMEETEQVVPKPPGWDKRGGFTGRFAGKA